MAQSRLSTPLRWLAKADMTLSRLGRGYVRVRESFFVNWLPPSQRQALSDLLYRHQPRYRVGGSTFVEGLSQWEEAASEHLGLSAPGKKVLLCAAGSGRELVPLMKGEHSFWLLEPGKFFCEELRRCFGSHPQVLGISEEALQWLSEQSPAALEQEGLWDAERPFDVVWVGWGGFSHVTTHGQQQALLSRLAKLAPGGRVLLSFYVRDDGRNLPPPAAHSRVDRILQRAGLPRTTLADALHYFPGYGVIYRYKTAEIEELAQAAGFEVEALTIWPYPHAILKHVGGGLALCGLSHALTNQHLQGLLYVVVGLFWLNFEAVAEPFDELHLRKGRCALQLFPEE